MIKTPLYTAFSHSISSDRTGSTITLLRKSDGAAKTFFLAGYHSAPSLEQHMFTLTDDQCEQFYPSAKKHKPAKQ